MLRLNSAVYTAAATGGRSPADVQFQRGFAAALVAMATAVHIDVPDLAELAGRSTARIVWPELEGQP